MSGRFVRASKFRHVHGEANKASDTFQDVRANASGEGNFIKVNPKWLAYSKQSGGGGPVIVHDLTTFGRIPSQYPVINVHKGKVFDIDFNPFMDSMLATASDDCKVKCTIIPDGFKTDLNEAVVTLEGHQKKVLLVHWHPSAANVLASASFDRSIKLWDVEAQAETHSFAHGDMPQSFEFNADGSQILSSCKDKTFRLFDPRVSEEVQTLTDGPDGAKGTRVFWASNHNAVGVVGHTKTASRRLRMWDVRDLSKPIFSQDMDQSAGTVMPFYDADTSLLYLAGKGDGNIRYFELDSSQGFKAHYVSDFRSNKPQKGVAFMPKRGLDTTKKEVARFYRLQRDIIEPISMCVPRKSDMFQTDLFPETASNVAVLTAAEYAEGKNGEVAKMSLDPKNRGADGASQTFVAKKSPAELQTELEAAHKRIAELEAQVAALSS